MGNPPPRPPATLHQRAPDRRQSGSQSVPSAALSRHAGPVRGPTLLPRPRHTAPLSASWRGQPRRCMACITARSTRCGRRRQPSTASSPVLRLCYCAFLNLSFAPLAASYTPTRLQASRSWMLEGLRCTRRAPFQPPARFWPAAAVCRPWYLVLADRHAVSMAPTCTACHSGRIALRSASPCLWPHCRSCCTWPSQLASRPQTEHSVSHGFLVPLYKQFYGTVPPVPGTRRVYRPVQQPATTNQGSSASAWPTKPESVS